MPLPSPEDDYTEFDSLFSGVGEHLQGTFKIEGTGEGFRYQKNIIATGLPYQTKIMRDNFKIQLVEDSKPDAKVLFEQDVDYGLNIVASTVPIPIFIAYPNDDERITTTIINGETIDPEQAHEFLDLGYTVEDGIDLESTSGPGVNGGEFSGIWQSPAYRQQVSEGNVFRIIQDGWRPIGLSKIATYKVSFKNGIPHFDALFDSAGALRTANPVNSRLELSFTYRGTNEFERRLKMQGLREPSLWKDDSNRLWLAAIHNNQFKLWVSEDDGRTMPPVKIWSDKDPTQKMEITILDGAYKFQRARGLKGGGALAWGLKSGKIYITRSQDGFNWNEGLYFVTAKRTAPYTLIQDERNGVLLLTNARDHVLRSFDGGRTWEDMAIPTPNPTPTT